MTRDRHVSRAELARETGVSRRQIGRLIAAGVLELDPDGKLPLGASKRAIAKGRAQVESDKSLVARDNSELRKLKIALTKAQGEWRQATAELQRIKVAHQAGKYVERADVEHDARNAAVVIQSVLRSIPQRCALALSCSCRHGAAVEHMLSGEIERAIGTLRESKYIQPTGDTLTVICGHCAERERAEAEEDKRRAELAANGKQTWQDTLRAALERCFVERPRAGDEIDVEGLPHELRQGFGAAQTFLRAVASAAYVEQLQRFHAADRGGRE